MFSCTILITVFYTALHMHFFHHTYIKLFPSKGKRMFIFPTQNFMMMSSQSKINPSFFFLKWNKCLIVKKEEGQDWNKEFRVYIRSFLLENLW